MAFQAIRIPRPGNEEPPVNSGITGDICYRCEQNAFDDYSKHHPLDAPATSDLYDLTCHTMGYNEVGEPVEEFLCADCITQEWAGSKRDFVPCPWCRRDAGLKRLEPLDQMKIDGMIKEELGSSESLQTRLGIAGTLVGITREECLALLGNSYVAYSRRAGGEHLLGAQTESSGPSVNPYLHRLIGYLHAGWKMSRYAGRFERWMFNLTSGVRQTMLDGIVAKGGALGEWFRGDRWSETGYTHANSLDLLLASDTELNEIYEHWMARIGHLANLFCRRHCERLAAE
ncbi:hypothetical protein P171DRAFT_447869 [Karstenula rhodostoma CBS 690.94]|uniref:Uncharacterized protein n=1 Tax=Karstenula rhodostoma CBS 690.94 TaxID=1392251 RepID=A0A9P4PB06_9PLEO|nr:hypothetical protein P171DRAFT_447869 [Karstenula rhodostoma CBS 690.94]